MDSLNILQEMLEHHQTRLGPCLTPAFKPQSRYMAIAKLSKHLIATKGGGEYSNGPQTNNRKSYNALGRGG
jgi:hypothetical protein